jgi:hypothetical protein
VDYRQRGKDQDLHDRLVGFPLTGLRLFLKSRRAGILVVSLTLAAVASRALGSRAFYVGEEVPLPIPWTIFLPLLSGYFVAASTVSPLPMMELIARRRASMLARLYLLAMCGVAVCLLYLATCLTPPPVSSVTAVRGFLGLLGLSLLSIAVLGSAAGWTLPCGAVFVVLVLRNGDDRFAPLDWLLADDGDLVAFVPAIALLCAGAAITWSRPFLLQDATD